MFSAVLGVVFVGIGYGVRPKKVMPTQPPLPELFVAAKSAQAKSEKSEKKAVKKRPPKKKT